MSAETLRSAAKLMRARAEACVANVDEWYAVDEMLGILRRAEPGNSAQPSDANHIASWHPAVALAVAKAIDDVADAWEICDDGWTRDLDDDAIRFEDTVDGGWLNVARAYLGESA